MTKIQEETYISYDMKKKKKKFIFVNVAMETNFTFRMIVINLIIP